MSRTTRALARAAVAVALVAAGLAAPRPMLAADDPANIPGIPLPGPVVTGMLGGPVYDVVYRLDVPPGTIVVASLTGGAGTDFDLYLFDSSATTVYTNQGVVASSLGPTSTEHVSYPTRTGGTFYLDLNGATNVEGTYRLAVQIVADTTPPTVSLQLDGGRAATNMLTVEAALTAYDDLSGIDEMSFSDDGLAWSAWQPFARTSAWPLTPGDGTKTVWVKITNGVGLESAPASASIVLDTVAPTVVRVVPAPGARVAGLQPRVAVTFNEALDPRSWANLGLVVQAPDGSLVSGTSTYDAASVTASWVPAAPLIAGQSYVLTLGNVTDVAGNTVSQIGSWTMTPLRPTAVTLRVTPSVVPYGGSVALDLALSGTAAPSLSLTASPAGGASPTTDDIPLFDGAARVTVRPLVNTLYSASYAGDVATAPASASAVVLVRRLVALDGPAPAVTRTARLGTKVGVVARVGPAAPGVSVSFRLYRYDARSRTYRYAGSWGRTTGSAGTATLTWGASTTGRFYWRAVVGSTPTYANNTSAVYRWTVR